MSYDCIIFFGVNLGFQGKKTAWEASRGMNATGILYACLPGWVGREVHLFKPHSEKQRGNSYIERCVGRFHRLKIGVPVKVKLEALLRTSVISPPPRTPHSPISPFTPFNYTIAHHNNDPTLGNI